MSALRMAASVALLFLGLAVMCIGVYGVFRFRYAANRMHAAALNDTLGAGLCLLGLAIAAPDFFTALKLLLVVLFLWLSSPVGSHLLCRLEVETNERREEYMRVEPGIRFDPRAELDETGLPADAPDGTKKGESEP